MKRFIKMSLVFYVINMIIVLFYLGLSPMGLRYNFAKLQGKSFIATPSVIQIDQLARRSQTEVEVKLTNSTKKKLSLTGAKYSCSCSVVSDKFPIEFLPNESKIITLIIRGKGKEKFLDESILLFSDSPTDGVTPLLIHANVTDTTGVKHAVDAPRPKD